MVLPLKPVAHLHKVKIRDEKLTALIGSHGIFYAKTFLVYLTLFSRFQLLTGHATPKLIYSRTISYDSPSCILCDSGQTMTECINMRTLDCRIFKTAFLFAREMDN